VSRIEQSGRMSLRRPKPPIKGGSAPEEGGYFPAEAASQGFVQITFSQRYYIASVVVEWFFTNLDVVEIWYEI